MSTSPKLNISDNSGPIKAPWHNSCPVSVIYDDIDNCFRLYADENCVVAYTVYDENETELQNGEATIVNGTATITLIGSPLADGSSIELIINGQTFVGTIEW